MSGDLCFLVKLIKFEANKLVTKITKFLEVNLKETREGY